MPLGRERLLGVFLDGTYNALLQWLDDPKGTASGVPTVPTLRIPLMPSPRIAIVRLSSIGDVIHGLPVLCALRRHFPSAALAWVVEDRAAALLKGHLALDQLIEVPRGWLRSPGTVAGLRQRLRQFHPEVTVDLQGLTKSAVAARLSGARRRIGFGDEKGREISWLLNNWLVRTTAAHTVDGNLELLRPLGIESPEVRLEIPESQEAQAFAERIVAELGLGSGFAIVNPGASWPSKLWPVDRYAAVARHLGTTHGLPTLAVWGNPRERGWADDIVAQSAGYALRVPDTSLTELAALARRARLFVGSDTGPLHVAAAVGTPCVGLYGPMPAERNGPYGPGHIAIQRMRFEGSSRQRRNAPRDLMEAIRVEDVCQACDQILRRSNLQ